MNYRHSFHAGNFADVHKHVVLMALLEHLHKKPAPIFVLDTHAGRGRYDLQSKEALRGKEWQNGIGRLSHAITHHPILERYRASLDSTAQSYSGSAVIAAELMRESDRAVFVEQQPEEAAALRQELGRRKRISILEEDGYHVMKSQLPPKENRGLVLIDPPFEKESEFADAVAAIQIAHGRWSNGTYCLWYPLKPGVAEQRFHHTLVASGIKRILTATLSVRPFDSPLGLNGSGLLIINPPWQFDEQLVPLQAELHRLLAAEGAGGSRVEWLVGE